MVDVIGVIHSVAPIALLQRKDGSQTDKRNLTIRDDSGASIEVTLWSPFAQREGEALEQRFLAGEHPVLSLKNARIGDFGGRSLSTVASTQMEVNPDIQEAGRLRNWCAPRESKAGTAERGRTPGGSRAAKSLVSRDTLTLEEAGDAPVKRVCSWRGQQLIPGRPLRFRLSNTSSP